MMGMSLTASDEPTPTIYNHLITLSGVQSGAAAPALVTRHSSRMRGLFITANTLVIEEIVCSK